MLVAIFNLSYEFKMAMRIYVIFNTKILVIVEGVTNSKKLPQFHSETCKKNQLFVWLRAITVVEHSV
ncbi:hypothetical protein [Okeania sp. KiyG1]|uniref:hypothetical protein n=1 Tax=Okeania sp. KiyG1 TaxID=2720165 RepID=UPI001921F335|nr:hypothetical protein [Okeania sp. KiyG1]